MSEHVEQRIEVDGPYFEDFTHGQVFEAPSVTLTTGFAALHQAFFGERLRLPRPLRNLFTVVRWRHCNHTAPVFEGDVLRTEATVVAKHPIATGGGLVEFAVSVFAERLPEAPNKDRDVQVLDWQLLGAMA